MKRVILVSLLAVASLVFAQQNENDSLVNAIEPQESEIKSQNLIAFHEVSDAAPLSLSVFGPGPYGQVDGNASGGNPPYSWYKNGVLVASGTSSVTLQFPCAGGVLTVKDSSGASKTEIITQCN